jgi:prepilin-type N-terminal cleavage/methylation domain-containing protein
MLCRYRAEKCEETLKMQSHAVAPPGRIALKSALSAGFTLIELSVVLVIIGLIVGGVLVGQELIKAATVRAQITQIEKFNTATNTFTAKYGYLPGDIPATAALAAGLKPRGQYAGEGDGNGLLEGVYGTSSGSNGGIYLAGGETATFWVDLSAADLIEGTFNAATPNCAYPYYCPSNISATTMPSISSYFPQAKLGRGNYIYAYSGLINYAAYHGVTNNINYFGLSAVTSLMNEGLNGIPV